jgi:hypothetical protein
MRREVKRIAGGLCALLLVACSKPEALTKAKAEEIIAANSYRREPIYAEVPQKVWWSAQAPKDAYDELAVRTQRNLERAGLVTVTETITADGATYVAKVTKKGFPILGTAPSHRGPVYRGKIAEKIYDGIRNFTRHPNEPTVGYAELVWHYDNPTFLYPLFETRINKPIKTPFVSQVSFHWEKHAWRFRVMVPKTEAGSPLAP